MAPKSKKKMLASGSASSGSGYKSSRKHTFITFEFEQIKEMTNNLDPKIRCGKGKYASVYKTELHSKAVAVKVYESASKDQAENELQALMALRSYPNIIPLIGTCFGDKYVFVMDYVPKSLQDVVDPKTEGIRAIELQWAQTLHIVKQLAYGVKAIIAEDYVVGDITPANVLVDEDFNVYICDFGSARRGGRDLPTKNLHYSAKEVGKRGKGDPKKTDIYSYGVILLQLIMKYNNFDPLDPNSSLAEQLDIYLRMLYGRKNKKAANSSGKADPHVSIKEREQTKTREHVVHKTLIESGCSKEDAKAITELGIACTEEEINSRPVVETVISILEGLNIG